MSVQETQAAVADYIVQEILFNDRARLPAPEETLLGAGGVVDSVGLHQLVMFIESRFGIEVSDMDIVPENFGTLASLAKFIEGKKG